jgi:hypothetical protein
MSLWPQSYVCDTAGALRVVADFWLQAPVCDAMSLHSAPNQFTITILGWIGEGETYRASLLFYSDKDLKNEGSRIEDESAIHINATGLNSGLLPQLYRLATSELSRRVLILSG